MSTAAAPVADIIVPQVGEAVAEVTIVRWHKQVGDRVDRGEALFEVDIDKATLDIEAVDSGELLEILAGAESLVQPLQVVGRLAIIREEAGK